MRFLQNFINAKPSLQERALGAENSAGMLQQEALGAGRAFLCPSPAAGHPGEPDWEFWVSWGWDRVTSPCCPPALPPALQRWHRTLPGEGATTSVGTTC